MLLLTSLDAALDPAVFGGKAAALARAVRAGLPVPPGLALSREGVLALEAGSSEIEAAWTAATGRLGGPCAVRSSAVGEDGATQSFAGVYETRLHVLGEPALRAAVLAVGNPETDVRIGVVVQQMVEPTVAGVLFTRHPVSGVAGFFVEASWGLGEAVVGGLITPDSIELGADGVAVRYDVGFKELEVVAVEGGGTEQREVATARAETPCLDENQLRALARLAGRCTEEYGLALDLEWAFVGPRSYLLQCRPITR